MADLQQQTLPFVSALCPFPTALEAVNVVMPVQRVIDNVLALH